jgi:peptidase E
MTTYILAGGRDRHYPAYSEQLARVVQNEGVNMTVLSCMFSKTDEEARNVRDEWQEWFASCFGTDVRVIFAEKESFFEQVKEADIIYLHGGKTDLLLEQLSDFQKVEKAFNGKIIIGSSAGANYLSNFCYSTAKGVLRNGSGILDMAIMVHYGQHDIEGKIRDAKDWEAIESALREQSGRNDVFRIPEGTFLVVSKQ